MMSGSGIRDAVEGGYVKASALGLSKPLQERICRWLARYEDAHFRQYSVLEEVADLDSEGLEIAQLIRVELHGSKVEYFSSARMMRIRQ